MFKLFLILAFSDYLKKYFSVPIDVDFGLSINRKQYMVCNDQGI